MPATTMCMKHPVAIHHVNRIKHERYNSLVDKYAAALHVSHGEHRLLKFYAACASGYTPAEAVIMKATDLSAASIRRLRTALINHGVAYMVDNTFTIDWERIRLFASMDPRKTLGKRCFIAPINPVAHKRLMELSTVDYNFIVSQPLDKIIQILSCMTEADYASFRRRVRDGLAKSKDAVKKDMVA